MTHNDNTLGLLTRWMVLISGKHSQIVTEIEIGHAGHVVRPWVEILLTE
jgi:hypothetical protein